MSTITINGKTYVGNNLTIINNRVIIDGIDSTPDGKSVTISVEGDIKELRVDTALNVNVNGNVNTATVGSAELTCKDITGGASTGSGDIKCETINGNVKTGSGDVEARTITGSVSTGSGDIITR